MWSLAKGMMAQTRTVMIKATCVLLLLISVVCGPTVASASQKPLLTPAQAQKESAKAVRKQQKQAKKMQKRTAKAQHKALKQGQKETAKANRELKKHPIGY